MTHVTPIRGNRCDLKHLKSQMFMLDIELYRAPGSLLWLNFLIFTSSFIIPIKYLIVVRPQEIQVWRAMLEARATFVWDLYDNLFLFVSFLPTNWTCEITQVERQVSCRAASVMGSQRLRRSVVSSHVANIYHSLSCGQRHRIKKRKKNPNTFPHHDSINDSWRRPGWPAGFLQLKTGEE